MNRSISFAALIICLLIMATVLAADRPASQTWIINSLSGPVSISLHGKGETGLPEAKTGDHLQTPFSVKTGTTGSLILSHGKDRVSIGPNASLLFPVSGKSTADNAVQVKQNAGSVLYKAEHRKQRDFSVETPYLVSVVKGTVFTITTSTEESTIALMEGSLQVMTPDSRQELLLEPGQVAVKVRNGQQILLLDEQKISTLEKGPVLLDQRNSRSEKIVDIRTGDTATGLDDVTAKKKLTGDTNSLTSDDGNSLSAGGSVIDDSTRTLSAGMDLGDVDTSGDLTATVVDTSSNLTGSISGLDAGTGDLTGTIVDTSNDLSNTVIDATESETSVIDTITQDVLK